MADVAKQQADEDKAVLDPLMRTQQLNQLQRKRGSSSGWGQVHRGNSVRKSSNVPAADRKGFYSNDRAAAAAPARGMPRSRTPGPEPDRSWRHADRTGGTPPERNRVLSLIH